MNKELFLKAVLQAADRLAAKAVENGPADIYDLRLTGTSGRYPFKGDDKVVVITHGERITCAADGSWVVEEQYRREELP